MSILWHCFQSDIFKGKRYENSRLSFALATTCETRRELNCSWIDQFRYIKIQAKTIDLSTRLWGLNPTNSAFIPQSLVLRSTALGWILIYRNWSIGSWIVELIMQNCSVNQSAPLSRFRSSVWNFWPWIADVSLRVSHEVAGANERRLYSQAIWKLLKYSLKTAWDQVKVQFN